MESIIKINFSSLSLISKTLIILYFSTMSLGLILRAEKPVLIKEEDGKLVYLKAEKGDTIPDFSYCGYKGGGVALPDVKVFETLSPQPSGDDTQRIQKAINQVSEKPLDDDGIRGAVLLKAGTYRVSGTLTITQSGVVLRGEGQHEGGTIIIATGTKKRSLITIGGKEIGKSEIPGTRRSITQKRVALGAKVIELVSTEGFKAGDKIIVFRPGTKEWIKALGTDKLNKGPKDKVKNWKPQSYNFSFERKIMAVNDKSIEIDAPIVFSMEERFGGGEVYKCSPDLRISNVGVENLRLISEYKKGMQKKDENHAWNAISIYNATDSWVRNVTAVHFGYSCVYISSKGKQVTVQDSACIDPVSKITGGRRYSFNIGGQLCLVQRCYTRHGRHDFVMSARVRGPNVFLDCVADNTHSDSGPHHRWAVGTLYDNISCGPLNVQWRGRSGTGHGWSGANMVFWNCRAKSIFCQKPPTANNYAFGCTGKLKGSGYHASNGKPVKPRSLYLKQLEERLGKEAVKNITIPEQLNGNIDNLLRKKMTQGKKSFYQ